MLFSMREKGQGLVEYALILVLVFVVVLVVLVILGPSIGNMYSNVTHSEGPLVDFRFYSTILQICISISRIQETLRTRLPGCVTQGSRIILKQPWQNWLLLKGHFMPADLGQKFWAGMVSVVNIPCSDI